jgi:hypothetical protein
MIMDMKQKRKEMMQIVNEFAESDYAKEHHLLVWANGIGAEVIYSVVGKMPFAVAFVEWDDILKMFVVEKYIQKNSDSRECFVVKSIKSIINCLEGK